MQSDDFHLLGTIKNPVWEHPIHCHPEAPKRKPDDDRHSANYRRKQNHAHDQIGNIVSSSEIGILVPGHVSVVVH